MKVFKSAIIGWCMFLLSPFYANADSVSYKTITTQDNCISKDRRWILVREHIANPFIEPQIIYGYIKGDSSINGHTYSMVDFKNFYNSLYFLRREKTKWYVYDTANKCDTLLFDESWNVDDTIWVDQKDSSIYGVIDNTGKMQGQKYWDVGGGYSARWIENVGFLGRNPITFPYSLNYFPINSYHITLVCCMDSENDTLYVERDYLHLITNIEIIGHDNISFSQHGNECVITLPTDVEAWSATLYNSVGVVVARSSGEGSEIVLPATSKGTHILVLNVGGRMVKKKVFVK